MSEQHQDMTLRLRAVEPEDLDFLYRIENDPKLWQVGITNVPYSKYTLTNYIVGNANDIYVDRQVRLVMENSEGRVIGMLDLTNFSPQHLRAEIGIVVVEPERNKGYGRQAIERAIAYSREVLHLHQLYAVVDTENPSSRHLFQTAGFQETGILRQWLLGDKKYHDAVMMQFFL
jgi:diamine N-acetyltransferase